MACYRARRFIQNLRTRIEVKMSKKQWGHGYHIGKDAAYFEKVNELLEDAYEMMKGGCVPSFQDWCTEYEVLTGKRITTFEERISEDVDT